MVRLYEYQGKQIFEKVGIPTPEGEVASTSEEAEKIAEKIGKTVAIKSQIWATGRYKAGGIKFADNPQEARKEAEKLIGSKIKGFDVEKVLIEEKMDIDKEYFASIIADTTPDVWSPRILFSTKGGVDIEQVAEEHPEKVSDTMVDITRGLMNWDAYDLATEAGVPSNMMRGVGSVISKLYKAFMEYSAKSAEINPLVVTEEGDIFAIDCRIVMDDSAAALRHGEELGVDVPRERDEPPTEFDKIAYNQIEKGDYRGVAFVQSMNEPKGLGYVGYHGIGGGGAILGVNALNKKGLKIANYADTSGNPSGAKVYKVAKLILAQPNLEAYVLAGHIVANQEQWHHAHGLVKAFREELSDKEGFPVVLLICGNKEKEAHEILKEGLKDLPVRLELYGSKYVFDPEFIAGRTKALVEEYREDRGVSE